MSGHPNRMGWFCGSHAECEPTPPPRDHVYRLVLLGPPGVGKGTQAELLCAQLRTCHLSTGDLFRAAANVAEPSPAMAAALSAMKRGELVSDELVMSMVRERSDCLRCHGGFLLDGVPRSLAQAEALEVLFQELGITLDGVLSYELPLNEIVERLGGRRTCADCRAVYHVASRPPHQAGICDQCGGRLMQREDDRPEAIRVRMQKYREVTQPLIDFYRGRQELISVPARGRPNEILEDSLRRLEEHLGAVRRRWDAVHGQPRPPVAEESFAAGRVRRPNGRVPAAG